ncbi:acyl carrier protein [Streptomyces sp. JNUCC 64]
MNPPENPAGPAAADLRRFVVALWCAELGVPEVADEDDFFALGGHSLAALNVLSDVEDAYQIELGNRAVAEHPTLADFVTLLGSLTGLGPAPSGAAAVTAGAAATSAA